MIIAIIYANFAVAERKPSFIIHSAVHTILYDFNIFITSSSSFDGFITNQFNDLIPDGLLAQLVERCTGIAEVKGSNPVEA